MKREVGIQESLDELRRYNLRIAQPRDGYRFSLDPLLLCAFAGIGNWRRLIDLGTGCGVIPLIMARLLPQAEIVGVEFQEEMAALASRNAEYNGLSGQVSVRHQDILTLKGSFPVSSFDLVLANPPYRKMGSGKVSPKVGRDIARHESTATLTEFLEMAKYLVKPGGSICFICHPIRLAETFAESARLRLAPLRLRLVHGTLDAEARMFMIELVKGRKGELTVQPPLVVYGEDGEYTSELVGIFEGD